MTININGTYREKEGRHWEREEVLVRDVHGGRVFYRHIYTWSYCEPFTESITHSTTEAHFIDRFEEIYPDM